MLLGHLDIRVEKKIADFRPIVKVRNSQARRRADQEIILEGNVEKSLWMESGDNSAEHRMHQALSRKEQAQQITVKPRAAVL